MNRLPAARPALLLGFLLSFTVLRSQDVILQGFYWNTHPGDVSNTTTGGIWWDTLATVAPQLAAAGFQTVWTPPPTKSYSGVWDMGYGLYDYFDLGEFDSKGTTRTRHGSRSQLQAMIAAMHSNNLKVMADVVLNHRGGADAQAPYQIGGFGSGYNVFTPPSNRIPSGPADVHPTFQHPDLNADYHNRIFFEDLCYFNQGDANPPTNADGSAGSWFFGAPQSLNLGGMGDSLIMWGRWLVNNIGYDELRLDAVKHIDPWFVKKFLIESKNGAQPFAVGESFDYGLSNLENYWNAVQDPANSGGVKNAKISLFDFPLRGALKSVLNNNSGSTDLYNTLGNAGLVWATGMGGYDVVTWLESHDTDRQGYVGAGSGCPIPAGASCLELHTEDDHDPIVSDKEDMGYPFLMAAEGRPVVFWKDWYWYGLAKDIKWQIALRAATATGNSDHIQHMNGSWPTDPPYDGDNHGGNMFAMRRDGLSGGLSDGMVLGLNDDPNKEHAVWVNTPFTNKYLKDYSDGYLFQSIQAFGDSRALIKAQKRDYSWWSPTGLYPKPAGTPASHFSMGAAPGGCPHFIAICAADAANLIVNGAPIAVGDEVAVKNTGGQVVGIGRIGQGFKWDGTHDMIIEALGAPSTGGLATNETFRLFVYDQSANTETEIETVQYASTGNTFNFSPERPNSPNRNGNFATFPITTTALDTFLCAGISRIIAFNTQVAVSQPFCAGDNAGNTAYSDGWQNGENSGTGLGAWSISTSGSAGFFAGSSANNGNGDGNSDGDINTGGRAWGLWANSGGQSNAYRSFAAGLPAGAVLSLSMDNGYVEPGNTVGFGLQNASGENLLEFYFVGNTNFYQYNDAGNAQNTTVGYTDEGLNLAITLTSATTYQLVVTQVANGASSTYSGSLKSPAGGQVAHQIRLFNANAGSGGDHDAFFNSIGICYPPTLVINEVDYDQPGASDTQEFIELKNVSASTINLDPYKVELLNSSGTVYASVDLPNVSLAAGDYYVICNNGSGVANCDLNFSGTTNQVSDGAPGAVRLVLSNSITVDALSYEGSVSGATEGTGVVTGDNNTTTGVGLARVPDGNDTNQNNSDFKLSCITPGNANVGNTNSDGDSYPDYCDNCPTTTNENQLDTDIDGIGDACDACPLAVDGLAHFNTNTCNCEPGYYPVTEIRNGESVIIGCQICPPGSYCPDGQTVALCPAGRYSNVAGATACLACAAGSFNASPGATECTLCPAGKFSNVTGAIACQDCAAGSYNATPGATECALCPPGKYSNVTGAIACQDCAAGSFNASPGATECTLCPAGKFSNVTGAIACQDCAAGSFNASPGATECTLCPAGKFSNVTGAIACQDCAAGSFNASPGATECTLCPAGKFSNVTGAIACQDCAAGSYNATPGATACALCPPGQYSSLTGATACLNCVPGFYNPSPGATECTACPPGKFSNTAGAVACTNCAAGSYNPDPGATECLLCPPGQFSDQVASTACLNCAAGSYSDTFGATVCTLCPPGKYSSAPGATACLNCGAGSYNPNYGAANCLACLPGTFSAVEGSIVCLNCPVNTYSSTSGASECLSCGSGFYSPAGSTACSMCGITFTATPTAESCSGAMDGQIAISNVAGGTAPFQYSIDNGMNYVATATFTGLPGGTYQVRVKDDFNCESAATNVMVDDNTCPITFSGTIRWDQNNALGVKDATVNLSGAGAGSNTTDVNGAYLISIPFVSGNFTLKPVKNINKTNGVTVLDAMAIQQHISNIAPITNPYKQIAADVNKSNSISTLDALLINQVLLGNPAANAIFNTSWRFVPSSYNLLLPPWGFPEQINLSGVSSDQSNQDFIGVKIGDVVATYANPANLVGSGIPAFKWLVEDQMLPPGQSVAVQFNTDAFQDLAAFQCAFRFDTAQLHFDSLTIQSALPLNANDFGLLQINAGELRVVWSAATGITVQAGAPAFRLHFSTSGSAGLLSEALVLNDSILQPLAYNTALAETDVELAYTTATGTHTPGNGNTLRLLQNRPNPFTGATTIGFVLPGACDAQLRVLDVNGREITRIDKFYPAGYNTESIRLEGISGLLHYALITPYGVLARKMIATGR